MPAFEYRFLNLPARGFLGGKLDLATLARELDELGGQGWEAVSAFDTNMYEGATREVFVLLKRERAATAPATMTPR
jgi:hypothetical protein